MNYDRDAIFDLKLVMKTDPVEMEGEFGLRNKRELWRVQMALSKIRQVRIIFKLISMRGRRAENRGHIGEEGRARKVERK